MKSMRKVIYLYFLIVTASCNNINNNTSIKTNPVKLESEIFDSFYLKFHQDTLFQINRIVFPLDGYNLNNENAFNSNSNFKWNRKEWTYHKLIKFDMQFKKETTIHGDSAIEKIYIPNSGFEIIRKFSKVKGKWFLVFYGNQDL